MAIIVFQHSDHGGPGRLGMTLRDHGFKLDVRRPDLPANDKTRGVPPDLDNVDGIVILGGAMNVTDIDKLGWMQEEAAFIKRAHEANLPIIGICLGAQLIAHALGGKVAPRDKPAIGYFTAELNTNGQTEVMFAGVPWNSPQLFSCGQEVKQLPPGAMLLAGSKAIPVQAYKVGLRTYGFIFHFECDREAVDALMGESKRAMEQAGTTPSEVAVQCDQLYSTFARVSDRISVNLTTYCFPYSERMSA